MGAADAIVAQATALAVQDATDYLRAMETISSMATGVAMAQLLATQEPKWILPIVVAQTIMTSGVANYTAATGAAIAVAGSFPSR